MSQRKTLTQCGHRPNRAVENRLVSLESCPQGENREKKLHHALHTTIFGMRYSWRS